MLRVGGIRTVYRHQTPCIDWACMSCSDRTRPDARPDISHDVKLRIRYLSAVRDTTGTREELVTFRRGDTLHNVAAWLRTRHGLEAPGPRVMAVLNGTGWEQLPHGLATEARDGDVIALFPPLAGG
jgi:molybdopterin converting factor small subunit